MHQNANKYFFLKGWFSICTHIVPFGIASLILLLISVPQENFLLMLASRLNQNDYEGLQATFWPAALLTVIASTIYFLMLYTDIKKAYVSPYNRTLRAIVTGIVYLVICSGLAYAVVKQANDPPPDGIVTYWSCCLLAVLSLNGVGWSLSRSWVEAVGVRIPDYTEANDKRRELMDTVSLIIGLKVSTLEDVYNLKVAVDSLRKAIEKEQEKEPRWARTDNRLMMTLLEDTSKQIVKDFANAGAATEFLSALNGVEDNIRFRAFQDMFKKVEYEFRLRYSLDDNKDESHVRANS